MIHRLVFPFCKLTIQKSLKGNEVRFWIIADRVSDVDRDVMVYVTESGDFVDEEWATIPVSIPVGKNSALLSIPTIDDNTHEQNGLVFVKLVPSSDYTIAEDYGEAVVSVNDNDVPSGISILALADSVVEGNSVEFQISASSAFPNYRTINLNVEQTGNFVQGSLPTEIVIDAFQTTAKLSILTLDDTIQELHGNITVSIQPGLNYRVATGGNSSATINIFNDDQPVIRISGEDIVEVENAIFTLTSSNPVDYSFDVNVNIAETGNFLANSYPETVEFNPDQTTATLELEIDDDNVKEDNGQIQIAILSGDDYQVALEPDNSCSH